MYIPPSLLVFPSAIPNEQTAIPSDWFANPSLNDIGLTSYYLFSARQPAEQSTPTVVNNVPTTGFKLLNAEAPRAVYVVSPTVSLQVVWLVHPIHGYSAALPLDDYLSLTVSQSIENVELQLVYKDCGHRLLAVLAPVAPKDEDALVHQSPVVVVVNSHARKSGMLQPGDVLSGLFHKNSPRLVYLCKVANTDIFLDVQTGRRVRLEDDIAMVRWGQTSATAEAVSTVCEIMRLQEVCRDIKYHIPPEMPSERILTEPPVIHPDKLHHSLLDYNVETVTAIMSMANSLQIKVTYKSFEGMRNPVTGVDAPTSRVRRLNTFLILQRESATRYTVKLSSGTESTLGEKFKCTKLSEAVEVFLFHLYRIDYPNSDFYLNTHFGRAYHTFIGVYNSENFSDLSQPGPYDRMLFKAGES